MKWLEKIANSENINQLPYYRELIKLEESDGIDLHDEWQDKTITIKDGTKVKLVGAEIQCFNEKKFEGHFNFYYIEDDDLYICAECGQWQKSFDDIEEIGYDDIFNKGLPYNWNEEKIKEYLKC